MTVWLFPVAVLNVALKDSIGDGGAPEDRDMFSNLMKSSAQFEKVLS